MANITLTINNKQFMGQQGQTILDISRAAGIEIPTLCEDPRAEHYGACGLCVVEIEGGAKLLRACSTVAGDSMAIHTDTARVRENRRAALELMLSDHSGDCRPPCMLACPAQTDCQGYVGLIANGEHLEAAKLIKEKIPLPASIGRVCPHPCESACRRKLVEEPISIAALKQYAGDLDLASPYTPEIKETTGKSIGIIGGGPGGLTAAYFLRAKGHDVTVYEAMPHMGGMLRYGIPEYRLPNAVLQKEIDAIEKMGIAFKNNVRIGGDVTLDDLRAAHDAVVAAVGAWTSAGLRCPGEDLEGVIGGIEFLREVDFAGRALAGKNVAVVGGGNTAMDACRTAVRLGAANVCNIYRRTKNEMPAEEIEIAEAEEEGVIFRNLTNPIEITGEDGRVQSIRLQAMTLGEPDASGRRSPIPVEGAEEVLPADYVVVAIGQKADVAGLEALDLTRRGTIAADERTFATSLPGVFAIGDATNNGASIAIEAIGEAKKAADMIHDYLNGRALEYRPQYLVTSDKNEGDFADREKAPRVNTARRRPSERRGDCREIKPGFSGEEARREAMRCLECGCLDFFECKLAACANKYQVEPEKYSGGEKSNPAPISDHPYLLRDPDKCVLCGLCVRVCEEAAGAGALGYEGRGFGARVKPALGMSLEEAGCIACGMCAAVCPTGALVERQGVAKQVPLREEYSRAVCPHCALACGIKLAKKGGLILRCLPDEADGLLCRRGRFGIGGYAPLPELPEEAEARLLEKIKARHAGIPASET